MIKRISDKYKTWLSHQHIARTARTVAQRAVSKHEPPVIFFNASARLGDLSQNAAFSLLSSWGLRLSGAPILHFVCDHGMSRCVLGTNPDDPAQPPPCEACLAQSRRLYQGGEVQWFSYTEDSKLTTRLSELSLHELQIFSHEGWPLGEIVLPALRWALRRHRLADDAATRFLYRQYILSAYNIGTEFEGALDAHRPQAVVVFNGIMYPEAIARWLALKRGLRVITHEVALQPLSAFFTEGQATAYPMDIPPSFQLNDEQNAQLDQYLSRRFQGQFTMAGIHFWRQMQDLDEAFLDTAAKFGKIVTIFTNVIFDTSQVHANTFFPHMFAWLDAILNLIKAHPETLFVIRAHPDEMRPGTRKQSRESVSQWVQANGVAQLSNVVFVDSDEYLSSYALIRRSFFVMVYNSSIGLEASILGKPVLCGGRARYTQYPTVFYPASAAEYLAEAQNWLAAASVAQPAEMVREARRVLYFQLFRTSLPFSDYLEPHSRMGYVHMKSFPVEALLAENSQATNAVYEGVVNGKPFLV